MGGWLSSAGLAAFVWVGLGALSAGRDMTTQGAIARAEEEAIIVRLFAAGDVNLGRVVGQRILAGDTLYPFSEIRGDLLSYDVVFANLECQLSDQGGETQHPRNNLIFTGPPEGAAALRLGGITHVSTANNHALDYGMNALTETIDNLRREGIVFSGTAGPDGDPFAPALFEVRGVRFAFFACTAIMNMEDRFWTKYVAEADTARLYPRIREARGNADFVLVSYHGGAEYSDEPSTATRAFAHGALEAGADLFLGHHPHVPQGIEEVGNKLIVYSLGNFVFYQPFAFWTQKSFALEAAIEKDKAGTRITAFRCLPLIAANQPRLLQADTDRQLVLDRIAQLSVSPKRRGETWPD